MTYALIHVKALAERRGTTEEGSEGTRKKPYQTAQLIGLESLRRNSLSLAALQDRSVRRHTGDVRSELSWPTSSTGLGALVSALKAARKANGDISIIAPSPQVQKLLKLTAMDRVFRVFPSSDEALQQLGGRSG